MRCFTPSHTFFHPSQVVLVSTPRVQILNSQLVIWMVGSVGVGFGSCPLLAMWKQRYRFDDVIPIDQFSSLSDVLGHSTARMVFTKFLASIFSSESLLFLHRVHEFRLLCNPDHIGVFNPARRDKSRSPQSIQSKLNSVVSNADSKHSADSPVVKQSQHHSPHHQSVPSLAQQPVPPLQRPPTRNSIVSLFLPRAGVVTDHRDSQSSEDLEQIAQLAWSIYYDFLSSSASMPVNVGHRTLIQLKQLFSGTANLDALAVEFTPGSPRRLASIPSRQPSQHQLRTTASSSLGQPSRQPNATASTGANNTTNGALSRSKFLNWCTVEVNSQSRHILRIVLSQAFNAAFDEIFQLLENDAFPRFIRSNAFAAFTQLNLEHQSRHHTHPSSHV